MPKMPKVELTFDDAEGNAGRGPVVVVIDANKGPLIYSEKPLFPKEWQIVQSVVAAIREHKMHLPTINPKGGDDGP